MSRQSRVKLVFSTQFVALCMLPVAAAFCMMVVFAQSASALPVIDTTKNLLDETTSPLTNPLLNETKKSTSEPSSSESAPKSSTPYAPAEPAVEQTYNSGSTSSANNSLRSSPGAAISSSASDSQPSTSPRQSLNTSISFNISSLNMGQIKDSFMTPLERAGIRYAAAQRFMPGYSVQTPAATQSSWIEASSKGWKIFGIAWYWWIFGLGIVLSIASVIKYREDSRGQTAGVLNTTK